MFVQPRGVLRHKVTQLAAQLDAGRPRADHHEGELLLLKYFNTDEFFSHGR